MSKGLTNFQYELLKVELEKKIDLVLCVTYKNQKQTNDDKNKYKENDIDFLLWNLNEDSLVKFRLLIVNAQSR